MTRIHLLVDYRSHFYASVRRRGASTDLALLKSYFAQDGFDMTVKNFSGIDFRAENYSGEFVLYQSAEDRGLHYKDYIEDILLGLSLQGANLIPDFCKFRAHHNKVFMEILRDLNDFPGVRSMESRAYGTFEDFRNSSKRHPPDVVMKPSTGAMSSGVRLLTGAREQEAYARKISRSFHLLDYAKDVVNSIVRKDYDRKSNHRRKFIVQNYVPGLTGDYKILIYSKKYYVLFREVRKNDFRASGSGRFSFRDDLPAGMLEYAEKVFSSFRTPYLSIDVAHRDGQFHLLEFQFLSFGNYTLEKSTFCFRKIDGNWSVVREDPILEREVAASVGEYVRNFEGAK